MDKLPHTIARVLIANRVIFMSLLLIFTAFMAYNASQLRLDAGFEKTLPYKHPYIKVFKEYEEMAGANRIIVAVRAREGDIFTPEFLSVLKKVTDEVFFINGVDRRTVSSIWTANVRYMEVVEDGIYADNVMPARYDGSPEQIVQIRENVLKAGIVGRLVANDFTAAIVSAQLLEVNPKTKERLDYFRVASDLEHIVRDKFQDENFDIHILGFAKVVGDIGDGLLGVLTFFAISGVIIIFLVYFYSHSWILTFSALLCSGVAVVWQLGGLTLLGYGIDPMSILVPFLVFAIGASHGVQMINGFGSEMFQGATPIDAAREAFAKLMVPGTTALVTDVIGFSLLYLIKIRMIEELAIAASLGVGLILFSNLFLLPLILSYVNVGENYRDKIHKSSIQREPIWNFLSNFAKPGVALVTILIAAAIYVGAVYQGQKLKIGDLHAGAPELHAESRYNQDVDIITKKFAIGVDTMVIIVTTPEQACVKWVYMDILDRFTWHLQNVEGVQSVSSLSVIGKGLATAWSEGNLKWTTLPRNEFSLVQAMMEVRTTTGTLNDECTVLPVIVFTDGHKADTIANVVAAVKEFREENARDDMEFKLASGNVGVMAGINEAVASQQLPILIYVYAAIIGLCMLTFRGWRGMACIVLPLSMMSACGYAVMTYLEIGLKVATLPVVALAVGIGVDYGIYIYSRLEVYLAEGMELVDAYSQTLRETGSAVIFTGMTLGIGVSTWTFSELKFQADMGLLLTFMFLVNMIGAITILPALACWFGKLIPMKR